MASPISSPIRSAIRSPIGEGGAFSPLALPNLVGWYDCQDYGSFTFNGTRVSALADKSGRGNHMIQATGAKQPLYTASAINSRTAIRYFDDGVGRHLGCADNTTMDFTNMSAYIVAQRVTDRGATERMFGKFAVTTPANSREFSMFITGGSDLYQFLGSITGASDAGATNTQAVALATPFVAEGQYSGTTMRASYSNGTVNTASMASMFHGTSGLYIGAREDNQAEPFSGYIGEVVWCTTAIDNTYKALLMKYFSNKWGITL